MEERNYLIIPRDSYCWLFFYFWQWSVSRAVCPPIVQVSLADAGPLFVAECHHSLIDSNPNAVEEIGEKEAMKSTSSDAVIVLRSETQKQIAEVWLKTKTYAKIQYLTSPKWEKIKIFTEKEAKAKKK